MKFSELVVGSEQLQPGVFNRAVIEDYVISNVLVKDMKGVRCKLVSAEVMSDDRKLYKAVIQVSHADEGVSEDSDVTVRCSCQSFRFWFGEANRRAHVLFGTKMPKYTPVPDHKRQRPKQPPKNPKHIPGMCKHVILLMKYMKNVGIASHNDNS